MNFVDEINVRLLSYFSDEIMREQFVKSGEWKLTSSAIEKSLETFNKYQTR